MRGKPHHKVDHEERKQRNQAQREEVKGTFFSHPLIDGFKGTGKSRPYRIAQHEAGRKERQGGADGGGKGNQERPGTQAEQGPGEQGQQRGAG